MDSPALTILFNRPLIDLRGRAAHGTGAVNALNAADALNGDRPLTAANDRT